MADLQKEADPSAAEVENRKRKFESIESSSSSRAINENKQTQENSKKKEKVTFPFGNYIAYYGYRYDHSGPLAYDSKFSDPRIQALEKKANKYFKNKDVLDVGCNTGHVTLMIAKKYLPRKIVGCDIDKKLIEIARKNISSYLTGDGNGASGVLSVEQPPATFTASNVSPLLAPVMHSSNPDGTFPDNLLFFTGDYCPKNDDHVNDQTPEYDTILALSVSKWIHLNNKDEGLLRFFQRVFNALRVGGFFILEPQGWPSYNKKKRSFPEKLKGNLKSLSLRPDMFSDILINDIGFKKVWKIYPKVLKKHENTNFEREILIFEK